MPPNLSLLVFADVDGRLPIRKLPVHVHELVTMEKTTVKSGMRVIEILEFFQQAQSPMTATVIGKELGYPKSSTSHLLHTLCEAGLLSFDAEGLYMPTLKLTALGDWIPDVLFEHLPIDEMVRVIHDGTQETATFSIPNGVEMEFVSVQVGTLPIALNLTAGSKIPMFGTAVGTAFLASKTDDEIANLHRRASSEGSLFISHTDLSNAMREVRLTRKRGYAVAYDRVLSDTGAVSVAVKGLKSRRTVTLGCGGLSSRIARNEEVIAKILLSAASLADT